VRACRACPECWQGDTSAEMTLAESQKK